MIIVSCLRSIEETLGKIKFVEDTLPEILTWTPLLFNVQSGLTAVVVAFIVVLLHELLSLSLEVPVQGEDGTVETLLQQAVHISGLVRLAAHPHVEQSQHDEDKEDDDTSQSHNDQQSYFIIGVELLRKKKCERLSLKRNKNVIQGQLSLSSQFCSDLTKLPWRINICVSYYLWGSTNGSKQCI